MSYFTRELKPYFERGFAPIIDLITKFNIHPNVLTLLGLLLVGTGSYLLFLENYFLSFIFLLIGALCDALDGAIARKGQKDSSFGAFIDSLTDRFSDAMPLTAIALSSQDKLLTLLSIMAIVSSFGVSYARARAEGLGYELKVGLFERAERWMVLLIGIFFEEIYLALVVLVLGSSITLFQRIYTFMKISRR
ncbi:CDP-alcohol phosphatidyltransferase family protein [Thermocrinis sp.]